MGCGGHAAEMWHGVRRGKGGDRMFTCPFLLLPQGLEVPKRVFPCATPAEVRATLPKNQDVLAFQCRNPIHRWVANSTRCCGTAAVEGAGPGRMTGIGTTVHESAF